MNKKDFELIPLKLQKISILSKEESFGIFKGVSNNGDIKHFKRCISTFDNEEILPHETYFLDNSSNWNAIN